MVTRKIKPASAKDIELNRWCIECAMSWPVITSYGRNGGVYSGGGGLPSETDADVIGRATKIKSWVTANS